MLLLTVVNFFFFFLNDTATPDISSLSPPDSLPLPLNRSLVMAHKFVDGKMPVASAEPAANEAIRSARSGFESAMKEFRFHQAADAAWSLVRFLRSEEHTSELQSPCNLVCRLLLAKK